MDPFDPLTQEEIDEFEDLHAKETRTEFEQHRLIEIVVHHRMRTIFENVVHLAHRRDDQKVVRDDLLRRLSKT